MRKLLLFLSFSCLVAIASARDRIPAITVGMDMRQVLDVAGEASSKKIMEIKRQEEWFYSGYSVLFFQGKVAEFNVVSAVISPAPTATAVASAKSQAKVDKASDQPDLLRSILKELPVTTTGTPGSQSPGGGGGGSSPLSPVGPPGPGGGRAGLAPMEVSP